MTKIMVVDDDMESCRNLAEVLRMYRYEVEYVQNAFSALDKLESFKPDLILVESSMPVMNGSVLAEIINSLPTSRKIPVLIMNSENSPNFSTKFRDV